MKIFGREPAAWIGLIEGLLALLLAWNYTSNLLDLTNETVGLIMAAVTAAFGLVTAFYTKNVQLAIVLGLVKAATALAVGYGLDLSVDQTAAIITFTTVAYGLFNRQQTSPATVPSMRSEVTLAA